MNTKKCLNSFSLIAAAFLFAPFQAQAAEVLVRSASLDERRENLTVTVTYCGDTGDAELALTRFGSSTSPDGHGGATPIPNSYQVVTKHIINEDCVRPIDRTLVFNFKKIRLDSPRIGSNVKIYGDRGTIAVIR